MFLFIFIDMKIIIRDELVNNLRDQIKTLGVSEVCKLIGGGDTLLKVAFNGDLNEFYKANRSEGFGKEVKRRILLGTFVLSAGHYDAYFSKAQQVRRLLVNKTTALFSEYDALIMPTAPTTAMPIGSNSDDPIAMYLADIYTVFANLTGLPAISIPLFKHSNGMPFGLQVLTNKLEEETLLQLSTSLLKKYRVNG